MVYLRKDGGEVIDPVQGEGREDCVEGIGLVGDRLCGMEDFASYLEGAVEGEICVAVEEGG
jgi:hypothetical protein